MAFRLCDLHLIWPRFTQQDWLQYLLTSLLWWLPLRAMVPCGSGLAVANADPDPIWVKKSLIWIGGD